MNKVILCGRLSKDVDIRFLSEVSIAKFSLAVDRKYKKDEEKKVDFINCVAFGNQATFVEKYFHKGDAITLEGRIQTGSYKNKEGQTVYTTDVVVENIEFPIGSKGSSNNNTNSSNNSPANDGFMNAPEGLEMEFPFN